MKVNTKPIILNFEEKIGRRQRLTYKKERIEVKITKVLLATESGMILAALESEQFAGCKIQNEFLFASALSVLDISDPSFTTSNIKLIELDVLGNQVIVLKYRSLLLVSVHESTGPSVQFVKLILLHILTQYLSRYDISSIDQFTISDVIFRQKQSELATKSFHAEISTLPSSDREAALLHFQAFGEALTLDKLVKEIYSKIDPLFSLQNNNHLTKMKLQEIMISSINTGQVFFHYAFCFNKYALLNFVDISEIGEMILSESQKLHQISKGKIMDPSQPFIIHENEINIIFAPRLINIVQIPLWDLPEQKLAISCIFKIRRNYQRQLRRSDLSSILTSKKYVRLLRNDENLKVFPFTEIDGDTQMYGEQLYIGLNSTLSGIKECLEHRLRTKENENQKELEAAKEEKEILKKSPRKHNNSICEGEEKLKVLYFGAHRIANHPRNYLPYLYKNHQIKSPSMGGTSIYRNEGFPTSLYQQREAEIPEKKVEPQIIPAKAQDATSSKLFPPESDEERGGLSVPFGLNTKPPGSENPLEELKIELVPNQIEARSSPYMIEEAPLCDGDIQIDIVGFPEGKEEISAINQPQCGGTLAEAKKEDTSQFTLKEEADGLQHLNSSFLDQVSPISFQSEEKASFTGTIPF